MGMTIDNHIKILKSCQYGFGFTGYAGNLQDSIDVAVDIMCRYQKIEEIVGNYGFDTSWQCLKKIREVIENGNAD